MAVYAAVPNIWGDYVKYKCVKDFIILETMIPNPLFRHFNNYHVPAGAAIFSMVSSQKFKKPTWQILMQSNQWFNQIRFISYRAHNWKRCPVT